MSENWKKSSEFKKLAELLTMIMSSSRAAGSDFEAVLGCGMYQVFVFVTYQLCTFLQASNMVFMSFGKVVPSKWSCGEDNNTTSSSSSSRNTSIIGQMFDNFNNSSIDEEEIINDQCRRIIQNGSCENFQWETDFYSIVPQWQLVCDRTGIVYMMISIQMLGVLIGSPIFGQISDAYGRKWTLFLSHLSLVLLDGLTVLSPNWQTFLAFRFLIGLACGAAITINFVLMTEMLKSKHRLWVTAIAGWPPSFGLFAGLAYATRDWRKLSLAMTVAGLPPLIMIPILVESPRWQLQKQKMDQARRSLGRVIVWNGGRHKEISQARVERVIDSFQEAPEHPLRSAASRSSGSSGWRRTHRSSRGKGYSFWHLCTTGRMTLNLAVLNFAYISISVLTYGLIMNNDKLTGNMFLNMFLYSCLRWTSNVLTPVIDASIQRCGRKLTTTISFAFISVCTTAVTVIMLTVGSSWSLAGHVITGLVLAANTMASPIWTSLNLTCVEASPTPIRNIALGVTGVFTRLGGVIAPMFLYMAELWSPSPYVLFAVLALSSSILCGLLLPETKGKAMPDKMPQHQGCWLTSGRWCCSTCCNNRGGRDGRRRTGGGPEGTTRSNSFTIYHFTRTNNNVS